MQNKKLQRTELKKKQCVSQDHTPWTLKNIIILTKKYQRCSETLHDI